jgi:hypothetical protein
LSGSAAVPRGIVLRAVALYVAVVGAAMLVVRIGGGGAWPSWVAFGVGTAGVTLITAVLLLPRLNQLREATLVAEALAAGTSTLGSPSATRVRGVRPERLGHRLRGRWRCRSAPSKRC